MDFEQLRQLTTVARLGTISAAAEELHITQPALSRSIRRLERDLGQDLFDRSNNSVTLNEAGRIAVQHAEHILADERLMRDDFDALARRERTVRIESVAPAPTWRLTALVVERFPGTILGPRLTDEAQARNAITNRDVDLAILRQPLALPTLRCIPLMTEDLYACVPTSHPLAAKRQVSFADLDGESFIIFKNVGFWMDVAREHLPSSQILEQEDREVFMQMLRTSDLLAFSSSAPENSQTIENRVTLPIVDADAHATFFLVGSADAEGRVSEIMDWVDEKREE
jgi:LysR family cyn operon transcriptional activator